MTKITLNGHTHEIPAHWREVKDRGMFIAFAGALFDFESGISSFDELRVNLAVAALGIDLRKVSPGLMLFENIYRVAELITFPYIVEDQEDGSRKVSVSIRLDDNIVGEVRGVSGYRYCTDTSGIVDTDMTAGQYIEGLSLLRHYSAVTAGSGNADAAIEVLSSLALTLYPLPKPRYSRNLARFSREEKLGILYNFRGITESIAADPDYDLIFRRAGRHSYSSPVGLQSSIFSLSKSGLGDVDKIRSLDVHTYLAALVQQTVDSIHTLAGSGMKPGAIAETLDLYPEQVAPFISNIDA